MKIEIGISPVDSAFHENAISELHYILGFAKGYIMESLRYPARASESLLMDSNGNSVGFVRVDRCTELDDLLTRQSGRLRDKGES